MPGINFLPAFQLVLLVLLLVPLLPLMLLQSAWGTAPPTAWVRAYLVAAAGASVLMLSGCGTAPSQAARCPPVPAELMEPPQEPALLQVKPSLKTPGPTTPKTPRDAASIEPGIDA